MNDTALPKPALHAAASIGAAFVRWPAWAQILALAALLCGRQMWPGIWPLGKVQGPQATVH